MSRWKRIVIGTMAAGLAFGAVTQDAGAATGTGTAGSQGTQCYTKVESQWTGDFGDQWRVLAWCDSIDRGVKVRGVLDVPWSIDEYTDWFTTTNKTYASDWRYGTLHVEPKSRIEYGEHELKNAPTALTFADGSSTTTLAAGQDVTVNVTVPADATGEMYFQVRHADGSSSDVPVVYHLVPGAGFSLTISDEWLEPGHNIVQGFYTGDYSYNASSCSASITVT